MVRMLGVYSSKSGSAEVELTGQTTVALMLDGTFRITGFVPGEPAEEEMVSTGYSTVKKSDLNNDNSYIDGADDKYASYSNIYEMIRGQVPGVQVSGTTILIRGVSSIKVSNEPLFVVDGVVTSGIGHINPSDVQSITVLKGASATQYGSRGSAGVIVITMKRSN
jgi:TonB-dependent SusC/RagA subfamily outer membrane receptor